jgi:dTDP-4-dehydrorhamnose reductase
MAACLDALQHGVVIHAQALSDVDRCQREPELAEAMNVWPVTHLVRTLGETGGTLLFLSTDYVFDGAKGGPYDEEDQPNPLSVYGASKRRGEGVALGYPRAAVIRLSTLFGPARMNFCDHVAQSLQAGRAVEAFADQVTSPSYTEDVAEAIAELVAALGKDGVAAWPSRILHVANAGGCSRLAFASRIAELVGGSREHVRPIRMTDQARPAPRPRDSSLSSRYLHHLVRRPLRSWQDALQAYLSRRRWLA